MNLKGLHSGIISSKNPLFLATPERAYDLFKTGKISIPYEGRITKNEMDLIESDFENLLDDLSEDGKSVKAVLKNGLLCVSVVK